MSMKIKLEGFKELEKQMMDLSRSANRTVIRNTLKKAAQPMVEAAKSNTPVDNGDLRDSITATTKLNKNQRRAHKKHGDPATSGEIFIGPLSPTGVLVEFGTAPHTAGGLYKGAEIPAIAPSPFMRPAFESSKEQMVDVMKEELTNQIAKAVKRAARKRAGK